MPNEADLFLLLAQGAVSAVKDGTDSEKVGGFALHAQHQLGAWLECPGQRVPIDKTHLRALFLFFGALKEALDPRSGTKIQVELKRKPGRPRVSLSERTRRSEAASIVHEYLGFGIAPNQLKAIKMAIEEMERRGRGDGLSVRILERTLQQERRLLGV